MNEKTADFLEKLNIKDIQQNNPHHGESLYTHIDRVFEFLKGCSLESLKDICNDTTSLLTAAICHDIGKPDVVKVNEKTGYDQFLGHADISASIFKERIYEVPEFTDNLSYDKIEYTSELIRLHDTKYSKQGKCQNMLNNHPNGFAKDLILLQYADIMGQSDYNHENKVEEVKQFASFIKENGTPEQTKGLDDVINFINDSERARIRFLNVENPIEHITKFLNVEKAIEQSTREEMLLLVQGLNMEDFENVPLHPFLYKADPSQICKIMEKFNITEKDLERVMDRVYDTWIDEISAPVRKNIDEAISLYKEEKMPKSLDEAINRVHKNDFTHNKNEKSSQDLSIETR